MKSKVTVDWSDVVCLNHLRLSENKTKEKFQELPLCMIRKKYEGTDAGKRFVEQLLQSALTS